MKIVWWNDFSKFYHFMKGGGTTEWKRQWWPSRMSMPFQTQWCWYEGCGRENKKETKIKTVLKRAAEKAVSWGRPRFQLEQKVKEISTEEFGIKLSFAPGNGDLCRMINGKYNYYCSFIPIKSAHKWQHAMQIIYQTSITLPYIDSLSRSGPKGWVEKLLSHNNIPNSLSYQVA